MHRLPVASLLKSESAGALMPFATADAAGHCRNAGADGPPAQALSKLAAGAPRREKQPVVSSVAPWISDYAEAPQWMQGIACCTRLLAFAFDALVTPLGPAAAAAAAAAAVVGWRCLRWCTFRRSTVLYGLAIAIRAGRQPAHWRLQAAGRLRRGRGLRVCGARMA